MGRKKKPQTGNKTEKVCNQQEKFIVFDNGFLKRVTLQEYVRMAREKEEATRVMTSIISASTAEEKRLMMRTRSRLCFAEMPAFNVAITFLEQGIGSKNKLDLYELQCTCRMENEEKENEQKEKEKYIKINEADYKECGSLETERRDIEKDKDDNENNTSVGEKERADNEKERSVDEKKGDDNEKERYVRKKDRHDNEKEGFEEKGRGDSEQKRNENGNERVDNEKERGVGDKQKDVGDKEGDENEKEKSVYEKRRGNNEKKRGENEKERDENEKKKSVDENEVARLRKENAGIEREDGIVDDFRARNGELERYGKENAAIGREHQDVDRMVKGKTDGNYGKKNLGFERENREIERCEKKSSRIERFWKDGMITVNMPKENFEIDRNGINENKLGGKDKEREKDNETGKEKEDLKERGGEYHTRKGKVNNRKDKINIPNHKGQHIIERTQINVCVRNSLPMQKETFFSRASRFLRRTFCCMRKQEDIE